MIFGPPHPPINFVHDHVFKFSSKFVYIFRIIGHVAAALGPLAFPSRSARPRQCTLNMYTNLLKQKWSCTKLMGWGEVQKSYTIGQTQLH